MTVTMRIRASAIATIALGGTGTLHARNMVAEPVSTCWLDGEYMVCELESQECDVQTGAGVCEALAGIFNYLNGTHWVADAVWCGPGVMTCSFHSDD